MDRKYPLSPEEIYNVLEGDEVRDAVISLLEGNPRHFGIKVLIKKNLMRNNEDRMTAGSETKFEVALSLLHEAMAAKISAIGDEINCSEHQMTVRNASAKLLHVYLEAGMGDQLASLCAERVEKAIEVCMKGRIKSQGLSL